MADELTALTPPKYQAEHLAAALEHQYALKHVDGNLVPYPNRELAQAAAQRMKGWPTTKHVKIMVRDIKASPWREADE